MAVRYSSREVRFWEKVDKSADCWTWTGAKDGKGYGRFNWTGSRPVRTKSAHIAAWLLSGLPAPAAGAILMHDCDNPSCVNPAHLRVGTKAQNSRDMVERGRSARGSGHSQAVLTEAIVMEFRRRVGLGENIKKTARELGIKEENTTSALYTNWKYLPPLRRTVPGWKREPKSLA